MVKNNILNLSSSKSRLINKIMIIIQVINIAMCIFFTAHDYITFRVESKQSPKSLYNYLVIIAFWMGELMVILSLFILMRLIQLEWMLWQLWQQQYDLSIKSSEGQKTTITSSNSVHLTKSIT